MRSLKMDVSIFKKHFQLVDNCRNTDVLVKTYYNYGFFLMDFYVMKIYFLL